jgi:hypothetical protein
MQRCDIEQAGSLAAENVVGLAELNNKVSFGLLEGIVGNLLDGPWKCLKVFHMVSPCYSCGV